MKHEINAVVKRKKRAVEKAEPAEIRGNPASWENKSPSIHGRH
jgi:hypothetical protein